MTEQTEKSIFLAAIEITRAAERAAFLSQACSGNEPLRAQIEALLQAHDKPLALLDAPGAPEATIDDPVSERPGTVIGPYKLMEQIGEGGMGLVFVAEQQQPVRRKVALKVIKPGMDTRQVVARFEAERQALALMDHPNIAKVHDGGTTDSGRPYFVMELVKGVPITDYCDHNQLPIRQRLELFVSVCQAVQHAHQKGIIHRDIKPSNVLVTLHDGTPVVKVIDFGVAKAIGQQLTEKTIYTQFSQMVGTPLYMSPEQAGESGLDVDTRSDIYSLGVLLYELLTGTTPFDKERFKKVSYDEIRRIIREEEPPKPSTRISTVGQAAATVSTQRQSDARQLSRLYRGELDWIVMRALEKDRNRRYETANGLARDVERYLNDEPVLACPPSAAYRFRKFARRNRAALTTVAIAAAALLIGSLAATWQAVRATRAEGLAQERLETANANFREAEQQRQAAQTQESLAVEQRKIAVANQKLAREQELLARRRFYASQMNLAIQAWEAGQPVRVLALLESQRPKIDEDDLRSFEWYYLWRLCQGSYRFRLPMLQNDNAVVVAISPDGKTVASGFLEVIKLWDTTTGEEKATLAGHHTAVEQLAWTPDGKTLVSCDTHTIRTWDLASGKERTSLTTGRTHPGGALFALAADGNTLVMGGATTVTLWNLATGKQASVVASGGKHVYHNPGIAPDGQTVAAHCEDGTVKVWARDGNAWKQRHSIPTDAWRPPLSFSPDGKVLGIGGFALTCYDVATGQARLTLSHGTGGVCSLSFSANGKVLASGGQDQTARLWDVATGRQLACLAHPVQVYGVVLSSDGKVVATATGDIHVWDGVLPDEAAILPHTAGVTQVAFSPNGKTLATAGRGGLGGTKLWNLKERNVIAPLVPGASAGWQASVVFSPDGRSVATANTASRTIEIWSVTGERQAVLEGHAQGVKSVAFSPDNKSLASASDDGTAILWDLRTRQPRTRMRFFGQMCVVAFSLNGKTLAAGSQFGVVKLFEAATGRETATLQRYEFAATWALALVFSPDSKLLAAGFAEGHVQVWEVATGRLHLTLKGHIGSVRSLSFSPDGRTLASAGEDHTVKLWDTATGQERCTLKGHKGPILAVAFAPDGNTLASGSDDQTVRLWPAAVDARARARKEELEAAIPGTPAANNELGDALWQYDRTAEAERVYGEALTRLEQLTAIFPDSPALRQEMIRSLLSRCLLLEVTSRPQEAGSARERARDIYRNLPANDQKALTWAFRERVRKLHSMGNRRQAGRTYSQTLALGGPSDVASFYRSLAQMAAVVGRWDEAVRHLSKALELHDSDWGIWDDRGCAYLSLNQPAKALSDFTKSLAIHTEAAWIWQHRGVAYSRLGKFDQAVADFSRVIELDPNGALGWRNRGYVEAQLGRWKEAAADFEKAVKCHEAGIELWYFHALTCLQAGDQAAYRKICAVMFERFGTADEPDTAEMLAWTCVLDPQAAPDPRRLVQLGERVVAKGANDPAYRTALGAALYRAGRFSEAIRQLAEASTFKPDAKTSPRYTCFFLAMTHHRQGNTDEARRWLAKAVQGLDSELADAPWNRRLTLQLLRREAEKLVEDKKKEDRK